MKKALLPALLASILLGQSSVARADDATTPSGSFTKLGSFGLGVEAEDFGVLASGKLFLGNSLALQAGVGFGYYSLVGLVANVDLVYEFPRFVHTSVFDMNWHLGGGATVGGGAWTCPGEGCASHGVVYGGGQVVGGVDMQFPKYHIELAAEARPTFLVGNSGYGFGWYPGGGVAARYFF